MDALGFRVSTAGVGGYRVFFFSPITVDANVETCGRTAATYGDGCGYAGGRTGRDVQRLVRHTRAGVRRRGGYSYT